MVFSNNGDMRVSKGDNKVDLALSLQRHSFKCPLTQFDLLKHFWHADLFFQCKTENVIPCNSNSNDNLDIISVVSLAELLK